MTQSAILLVCRFYLYLCLLSLLGIRAGMFVRDAKALCPHLVIFPYNFEAYEEVRNCWVSIADELQSKMHDNFIYFVSFYIFSTLCN